MTQHPCDPSELLAELASGQWTPQQLLPGDLLLIARRTLLADLHRREEFLEGLDAWPGRELAILLEEMWNRAGADGREFCALVLGRYGAKDLERFCGARSREGDGATWLAEILSEATDATSTRLLLTLLDHPSRSVARRASSSLGAHRTHLDAREFLRELALPLLKGLEYPPPLEAIRALHRIADPVLEPDWGRDAARRAERVLINSVRLESRAAPRGDAIAALGEIGSRPAVRCLVDMLGREDLPFHRDVVISLRKIRPERAMIALLGLLRSQDPILREEAANALGEIGDPQAVQRLLDLLDDPDPDVRQEAVLALGKLGGRGVLEALKSALRDPDAPVRQVACHALAEALGNAAQGQLLNALYDASADVRAEAAFHLGNIGNEAVRAHLELWADDLAQDAFGDPVGRVVRQALWRLQAGLRAAGQTG